VYIYAVRIYLLIATFFLEGSLTLNQQIWAAPRSSGRATVTGTFPCWPLSLQATVPAAVVHSAHPSLHSLTDQQWELGRSTQQELRATVPMVENSVLKVRLLGSPFNRPFTLTKETSVCGDGHPSFLANKRHSSGAEMASARSSASSLRLLPTRRLSSLDNEGISFFRFQLLGSCRKKTSKPLS
jgi:hypothetical protein